MQTHDESSGARSSTRSDSRDDSRSRGGGQRRSSPGGGGGARGGRSGSGGGGRGGGGRRPFNRRRRKIFGGGKVCQLCARKIHHIDYKDLDQLRFFVSGQGRILPRRMTGACAKHQRQVTTAVKRARNIALLPFSG
ncbi:MAG: 30S ribosomal protein S18 [Candidatus Sumerlaeota bacterium]